MSVPVLTFFNQKGRVGRTSLVYHVAWMMAELGHRVVAIDLDPQANLTSAFLEEEALEELWEPSSATETAGRSGTIYQCVRPMADGGDLLRPQTRQIAPRLQLVPGDLALAGFENVLSQEWLNALGSDYLDRALRTLSSFWVVAQMAAQEHDAELIIADVGPSLGAINRSALIATDHVVVPLADDLFALQVLRNLGPTLRTWRAEWTRRVESGSEPTFELPRGDMEPLGYVLMQHTLRLVRPVMAYSKWAARIPEAYAQSMLQRSGVPADPEISPDPCLARLKHYRSLVHLAQEARKPMFSLSSADGAVGSHAAATRDAHADFKGLAQAILARMGL